MVDTSGTSKIAGSVMVSECLSDFQVGLRDDLVDIFSRNGREVIFVEKGEDERYLYAEVVDLEAKLWLYEDEAELRRGGKKFLYENHTGTTSKVLASEFLDAVKAALIMI